MLCVTSFYQFSRLIMLFCLFKEQVMFCKRCITNFVNNIHRRYYTSADQISFRSIGTSSGSNNNSSFIKIIEQFFVYLSITLFNVGTLNSSLLIKNNQFSLGRFQLTVITAANTFLSQNSGIIWYLASCNEYFFF